ncbi:MAG: hypothetical protein KDA52_20075 [Planctomycetaceae bacterium]|nr:hypothetical protein [Planctomycetaceae bacterium]
MFDADSNGTTKRGSLLPIAGLAVLSLLSLIVKLWILTDFPREQQIIEQLTPHLPAADQQEANELAGGLRLQSRLAFLLIANLVASTVAFTLLIRAYLTSQRSLRNVHVVASDILASLDQGVITTDQQTAILSINPRGRELLDVSGDGTELAFSHFPPDHHPLILMATVQVVIRSELIPC